MLAGEHRDIGDLTDTGGEKGVTRDVSAATVAVQSILPYVNTMVVGYFVDWLMQKNLVAVSRIFHSQDFSVS
jgi:hypothetical protein